MLLFYPGRLTRLGDHDDTGPAPETPVLDAARPVHARRIGAGVIALSVDPALLAELDGPGEPVNWAGLDSPSLAALLRARNAVILPFGAVEQHGAHLPTGTDCVIATHVAQSISALTGILVLPVLSYGISQSHGAFAGTVGLTPELFIAVVGELLESLHRSGARQFVLLNAHGWNSGALAACADNLRSRYDDIRVRALDYSTCYPEAEIDGHVEHGRLLSHAGHFETSCMLHLDPASVRMQHAVAQRDWPSFWDYRTDQVSESGAWGRDVAQANGAHGEAVLARCVERTARAIAAGIAEPRPRIGSGSGGPPGRRPA